MLILVKVKCNRESIDILFDPNDGFEILNCQIESASMNEIDLTYSVLIDFSGRTVSNLQDLDDVKIVSTDAADVALAPFVSHLWFVHGRLLSQKQYCSASIIRESCIQPCSRIVDTTFQLCSHCTRLVSPDLLVPSENLALFSCDRSRVLELGLGFLQTEQLLLSDLFEEALDIPVLLYLQRRLLDSAVKEQQSSQSTDVRELDQRLKSGYQTVMIYEDPTQKECALQHIEFETILSYAIEFRNLNVELAEDVCLFKGLLRWFKGWFTWCNKPNCSNSLCSSLPQLGSATTAPAVPQSMENVGTCEPSADEKQRGWAGRTEVYRCHHCQTVTRFPRYNNPSVLLETRRGRCGEWANCFCLICRSLGIDARWVLDFTDHVWVEVWIPSMNRYVHADPCENKMDAPLMYESGWKKSLTYVISFSRHGIVDATAQYSRKLGNCLNSRDKSEWAFRKKLFESDRTAYTIFMSRVGRTEVGSSLRFDSWTAGPRFFRELISHDISDVDVVARRRRHERELLGLALQNTKALNIEEAYGRSSGDIEWRRQRGELGAEDKCKDIVAGPSRCERSPTCAKSAAVVEPMGSVLPTHLNGIIVSSNLNIIVHFHNYSYIDISIGNVIFGSTSHERLFLDVYANSLSSQVHMRGLNASHYVIGLLVCPFTGAIQASLRFRYELLESISLVKHLLPQILDLLSADENLRDIMSSFVILTIAGLGLPPLFLDTTIRERSCWVLSCHFLRYEVLGVPLIVCDKCGQDCIAEQVSLAIPDLNYSLMQNCGYSSPIFIPTDFLCVSGFFCRPDCFLFSSDLSFVEEQAQEACLRGINNKKNFIGYFIGGGKDENYYAGLTYEVQTSTLLGTVDLPDVSDINKCFLRRRLLSNDIAVPDVDSLVESCRPIHLITSQILRWVKLGGNTHPDTVHFHLPPLPVIRQCPKPLVEFGVYAGENFVNGISCRYSLTASEFIDLQAFGNHDAPVHVRTNLVEHPLSNLRIKYGAIIDSLAVSFTSIPEVHFGGTGGDLDALCDLPSESSLCGCFGGYGGHLHCIGIVIFSSMPASEFPNDEAIPLEVESLYKSICARISLAGIGETLLDLSERVYFLVKNNEPSLVLTCLKTICIYFENIIKSPLDDKKRCIKINNEIFKTKVLSVVGASRVFLFPLWGFKISGSNLSVIKWCENVDKKDFDTAIQLMKGFVAAMKSTYSIL